MTDKLTTLRALKARIDAASGPDRELDADILCAVDGWTAHEVFGMAGNTFTQYRDAGTLVRSLEPLTASIDAAVALVERVLPERSADITCRAIEAWQKMGWRGLSFVEALPLAIISQLFAALIAKEELETGDSRA